MTFVKKITVEEVQSKYSVGDKVMFRNGYGSWQALPAKVSSVWLEQIPGDKDMFVYAVEVLDHPLDPGPSGQVWGYEHQLDPMPVAGEQELGSCPFTMADIFHATFRPLTQHEINGYAGIEGRGSIAYIIKNDDEYVVIMDDRDEGIHIEVFGSLIPNGAADVPVWVVDLDRNLKEL